MPICPCCSNLLLRHIRQGTVYWLCRSCRAEMPNFADYQKVKVGAKFIKDIAA